jgi:hypothetical protein
MKVLSIRQPWAYAILHLGKRVENRSWYTPFRGEFLIHAAKKWSREEKEDLECFADEIRRKFEKPYPTIWLGRVVGIATLVDCVRAEAVPVGQETWGFGPWCFVLENVRALDEPYSLKGMLGFFETEHTDKKMVEHMRSLMPNRDTRA